MQHDRDKKRKTKMPSISTKEMMLQRTYKEECSTITFNVKVIAAAKKEKSTIILIKSNYLSVHENIDFIKDP